MADYRKEYIGELRALAQIINRRNISPDQREIIFNKLRSSEQNMYGLSIMSEED